MWRRFFNGFRVRVGCSITRAVTLAFILFILVWGFIIGGLARLALPGPDPMPLWATIALGIVGAIVGALGRLLHPGRDPMGWIVTILIGIASLVIAGIIFSGFWEFVIGVIVAIILVALVGRFFGDRRRSVT